ncbi:MAG: phosphatase PAP2 family protein [Eubacteriales bacterium]|nr:phosphatase PAP2 family protein [Eubacteriales bacterium]
MKEKLKQNGDVLLGALCSAVYLLWFSFLENTVKYRYHIIHVALDDYIPFCEYFIIPYLLWFFYVGGMTLWFFKHDRAIFRKLIAFLFIGMFTSLLFCTLYPNGTDFRPAVDADKNVFTALVARLYRTDTPTNVFPSIHVYNSIGIQIAVMQSGRLRRHRPVRIASGVLCVLICLSTMFLKQHSVLDVLAASFLAFVVYGTVYAPEHAQDPAGELRRRALLRHSED